MSETLAALNPPLPLGAVRTKAPALQHSLVGPGARTWWWPEALAALLALSAVMGCVLSGFHPATWQASGSDLKTLYASAELFRLHQDPYNFQNINAVFHANNVVPPASWYAHAPVYPPFTLAAISLMTWIPMVPAVYLWMALSTLALAAAAYALAVLTGEVFGLSRGWRLALIAVFAASPLISFGLEMCNVSPLVAALCMIAVVVAGRSSRLTGIAALCLSLGLLLKPHLAVWVLLGLLISRSRVDRRVAVAAGTISAAATLALGMWMAAHHLLRPDVTSYAHMVGVELSGGSMAPNNHELMAVAAQITSLTSLLGYAFHGRLLTVVSGSLLLLAFAGLFALSLRVSGRQPSARLVRLAAWSAFGLIATYHRAHDGVFLLITLPLLLARLRTSWRAPFVWAFAALSFAMAFGPRWETMWWLATKPGLYHLANFLLYRQSPLAAALLVALLLAETARQVPAHCVELSAREERREYAAAA